MRFDTQAVKHNGDGYWQCHKLPERLALNGTLSSWPETMNRPGSFNFTTASSWLARSLSRPPSTSWTSVLEQDGLPPPQKLITWGRLVVAAQMLENAAPHENVDTVHDVQRRLERAVQRRVCLIQFPKGDVVARSAQELIAAALRGNGGSRKYERSDEQEAAHHSTDYAAQAGRAASTPADQCVIIKRSTTWL